MSSTLLLNSEEGIGYAKGVTTRPLGSSELSYFLPSRGDGVNDMYLHLGFHAPAHLLSPSRLATIWAIQRSRHPLLAAHIKTSPSDVGAVRFEHTRPGSAEEAIKMAQGEMDIRESSKD
ncbi:hypothetical protein FRC07_010316, partial [Ceratobasidium sp. 392]